MTKELKNSYRERVEVESKDPKPHTYNERLDLLESEVYTLRVAFERMAQVMLIINKQVGDHINATQQIVEHIKETDAKETKDSK